MTSPVERISGPSSASAPGKRANGSTASLTATAVGSGSRMPIAASCSPAATRHAMSTSPMPIAFSTNGTVRLARGFASSTYIAPSCSANCTFTSPRTPSARAIARVWRRISSSMSGPIESGGITQAESPEWTPASSTCSITAPITTVVPSHTASTSTSIASSTKRSTSVLGCTGRERTSPAS